jgi:hypothetical protein
MNQGPIWDCLMKKKPEVESLVTPFLSHIIFQNQKCLTKYIKNLFLVWGCSQNVIFDAFLAFSKCDTAIYYWELYLQ